MPENLEDKDVRELVEILRFARMAKALNLSKEETVGLMHTFENHREKASELNQDKRRLMDTIKDEVRRGGDDEVIQSALDNLIEIDRELATLRLDAYEAMREGLTPSQQAKLYVFMTEFEGDIRRMVQRARSQLYGGQGGRQGPRPGAPNAQGGGPPGRMQDDEFNRPPRDDERPGERPGGPPRDGIAPRHGGGQPGPQGSRGGPPPRDGQGPPVHGGPPPQGDRPEGPPPAGGPPRF